MLQRIKEHSGSWLVKILFVLIAISFASWGISDIITGHSASRPVAKVDGTTISQEEFYRDYQRAIKILQQRSKDLLKLTPAKKSELQTQIMDQLIDNAIASGEIKKYKLEVADAYIANMIKTIPTFQNEHHNFDRQLFERVMQANEMNEAMFIKTVRKDLQQRQLFRTLSLGVRLPKFYQAALFEAQEEKKVFLAVHIPLSKMNVTDKPTKEELETLYKDNPEQFTRPEMREISTLVVDPAIIRSKIDVSEDELKDEYEKRKSEFVIPAKRHFQQISSSSQRALENVSLAFDSGNTPAIIARNIGGEMQDLPDLTKDQLPSIISAEQADEIFNLETGHVSFPVQISPTKWACYVALATIPEVQKTFEEVQEDLKTELQNQRSSDVLYELRNKVEDGVAGGASYDEVATAHNLQVVHYQSIDNKGHGAEGKSPLPKDIKKKILEQAFEVSEGNDSSTIELPGGGMLVLRVNRVHKPTLPSFEEIRGAVETAWLDGKRQKMAADLAKKLTTEENIKAFQKAAKDNGLEIQTLGPVNRIQSMQDVRYMNMMSDEMWRKIFNLPKDSSMEAPAKTGFYVVMLKEVKPIDFTKTADAYGKFTGLLKTMVRDRDFPEAYIKFIRANLEKVERIEINQSIIDKMTSHE